jgi:hypothetical protein
MESEHAVRSVLSYYFRQPEKVLQIEPLGNHGGWSGSQLWRIGCEGGERFCLRRWPTEHPAPERLRFIHELLSRVASLGMTVLPISLPTLTSATFAEQNGHRWELTPWMPGKADFHAEPTRPRLRTALQALAQFHNLSALGQTPLFGRAPCLTDRQQQIAKLRAGGLDQLTTAVTRGFDPQLDQRAHALLPITRGRLENLAARLEPVASESWALAPAIRDIHHDHILFTGDQVSGIVDFGSLRIDLQLTDIARLVGSLVGDDVQERQFAFASYSELRTLNPRDMQLINLLDESSLLLGGLNWLTWLYLEHRNMGPLAPIVNRLDQILIRLARRT